MDRSIRLHEVLRYPNLPVPDKPMIEGYRNFFHVAAAPYTRTHLMLERGINAAAEVEGPDGRRRPVVCIRSSPWKAGHETNPWHDEFDLDHGHVRYFGDHKPSTPGLVGSTAGNRALLEAWQQHSGTSRGQRELAPPLLIFRGQTVTRERRQVHKGHVEFCGAALIERIEHVVQRDPLTGRSFPNLVFDLLVVDVARAPEGDSVDFRWIDDRRDQGLSAERTLQHAPRSWRDWVERGRLALPRVRRRVLSSRVLSHEQQLPLRGSPEEMVLEVIYRSFEGRKHTFELLAAKVAAAVLGAAGSSYREGWLTRPGGDGGLDFVARLDVGSTNANTPVVVLGQAKCIKPTSAVSPDEVARLVARLRRGWIGVFITTGAFSRQAQVEMIDDQYPVVLVSGLTLAKEVRRLAHAEYSGDLESLIAAVATDYQGEITHRRPEEILSG